MTKSICIVSPDVMGPIFNGGIGTFVYHSAKIFTNDLKHRVTVLMTGATIEKNDRDHWKGWYRDQGIELLFIDDLPRFYGKTVQYFETSHRVHQFLREREFSFVNFQEWLAHGFVSIQAKRTGEAHHRTVLSVTTHSPTEWQDDGMKRLPDGGNEALKMMWCERYCCRHADLLISPSRHMFEWMQSHGWELAQNRAVAPLVFSTPPAARDVAPGDIDLQHFIFFGRLEVRKGIELFFKAADRVATAKPDALSRLTLLGKLDKSQEPLVRKLTGDFIAAHPAVKLETKTTLCASEALDFIEQSRGVAVMPSLLDNLPFTAIECVERKLPFIASKVGGIPEIADPAWLTEPAAPALAQKMLQAKELFWRQPEHPYSRDRAIATWREVLSFQAPAMPRIDTPRVSVCIPHFNYGKFLPDLLAAFDRQDYANFEVVLVDDGSTDPASRAAFDAEKEKWRTRRPDWQFHAKPNGGIGHTRNYAAQRATGDYLIFFDADNIPTEDMISSLSRGIQTAGADCVTCYFVGYPPSAMPSPKPSDAIVWYFPVGPSLECGVSENVFGDAHMIIRKDVFDSFNGFTEDRTTSWEDYELLARLVLAGRKLEVLPRPLQHYTITPDGWSRTTTLYDNRMRVLRQYLAGRPKWQQLLLKDVVLATHANALSPSLLPLQDWERLHNYDRVWIYGAGAGGKIALRHMLDAGCDKVNGFVDSFRRGTHEGLPVIMRDDLLAMSQEKTALVFASTYWQEIWRELRLKWRADTFVITLTGNIKLFEL